MDQNLKSKSRYPVLPVLAILLGIAMIAGCGEDSAPTTGTSPSTSTVPAGNTAPSPATPVLTSSENEKGKETNSGLPAGVTVTGEGKKELDDIPYDIWFEKPLAQIEPADLQSPAAAMANAGAPPSSGSTDTAPSETGTPVPAGGTEPTAGGDWNAIVSPTVLEDEVTRVSISLGGYLNQLGNYNRSLSEIEGEAETLVAIALVASQLTEPLRWKDQAFVLADCGSRLSVQATEPGRTSFKAAQVPLQQIHSVLNGESVSLDHDVDQSLDFSQRVDRGAIMYRMETAFEWLANNVNDQGKLKSEQKQAEREAAILTMFGKIIASPGYPSAEETGYHEQAVGFTTTAKELQDAIKADEFTAFQTRLDRLEKHCADCHADYRFE